MGKSCGWSPGSGALQGRAGGSGKWSGRWGLGGGPEGGSEQLALGEQTQGPRKSSTGKQVDREVHENESGGLNSEIRSAPRTKGADGPWGFTVLG